MCLLESDMLSYRKKCPISLYLIAITLKILWSLCCAPQSSSGPCEVWMIPLLLETLLIRIPQIASIPGVWKSVREYFQQINLAENHSSTRIIIIWSIFLSSKIIFGVYKRQLEKWSWSWQMIGTVANTLP